MIHRCPKSSEICFNILCNHEGTAPVCKSQPIKSEVDIFKEKLKEEIVKRKSQYHKNCLVNEFDSGRFWGAQEILELIDTIKP